MALSTEQKFERWQRALNYGGPTHRITDVIDLVKAGRAQFWEHGDGVIITEFNDFPLMRTVNYWQIFGRLEDCLALDARITDCAIREGCRFATATGRKGWGRAGAPYGWRPWWPNFVKPLVGEA
jgi:hypothetical protein